MKTFLHLWQYLAEVFFGWKIFEIKFVEKMKTHILYSVTFSPSRKSCRLWGNVEKYGGAIHLWQYLAELFFGWIIFEMKICRENENTHFIFSDFFPLQKIMPFMR